MNTENQAKTATFIKDHGGFKGYASLYRCDPPHEGHEFVIASATTFCSRLETYLFPATSEGKLAAFDELDGSTDDVFSHDIAWANAGYVVIRPDDE